MEGKQRYYFKGDLRDIREAIQIAQLYGFEAKRTEDFRGYVEDEEQYKIVVKRLIEDRIAGYWHYPEFWKK